MTVLKTVEDVGATLAWYPGAKAMVALGTTEASGAGFDDYGARLELHALDLTDESATSKPAAVATLRAKGAFLVSASWNATTRRVERLAVPRGRVRPRRDARRKRKKRAERADG